MLWYHSVRNVGRSIVFAVVSLLLPLSGLAQSRVTERTPADNDNLRPFINTQFGLFLGGTAAGFVPEPFTSLAGEGVAIATDAALKFTPPVFGRISDKMHLEPNAPFGAGASTNCVNQFTLQQYQAQHKNLFGFNYKLVPEEVRLGNVVREGYWGPIVSPGEMTVFHQNSDVTVTLNGPGVVHDEALYPLTVQLTEGQHQFLWEANTQLSPIFDLALPVVLYAFFIHSETKATSPFATFFKDRATLKRLIDNPGSGGFWDEAAAAGLRSDITKTLLQAWRKHGRTELLLNLGIEAVNQAGEPLEGLLLERFLQGEISFARNSFSQTVTVLDTHTPTMTATTPHFVFEATDFGGTRFARKYEQLTGGLQYEDQCGSNLRLTSDAPNILPIGTAPGTINWTVTDVPPGVDPATYYKDGITSFATAQQTYLVQDTRPPILVAPAGLVIESSEQMVDPSALELGRPLVIDLADPQPVVSNDAPPSFEIDSRIAVSWTATDASGNENSKPQWISAKTPDTNTAPTIIDVSADTRTAETVEIRLDGIDFDLLPTSLGNSIVDPLSFKIVDYPEHGDFEAPLRPHFIEDFRLTPLGESDVEGVRTSPLGDNALVFSQLPDADSRARFLNDNYCGVGASIPVNFVYEPTYVHVTDSGDYYVRDSFWECSDRPLLHPLPFERERISKWNGDREFLNHYRLREAPLIVTQADIFSVDEHENIYWAVYGLLGNVLGYQKLDRNLANIQRLVTVPILSADGRAWKNAHGDLNRGVIYAVDNRGIVVFDASVFEPSNALDDFLLVGSQVNKIGELAVDGDPLLFPNTDCGLETDKKFWMTTDSDSNLYVAEACQNRIHKFGPSTIDLDGNFVAGEYVGWMGKCTANVLPWSACEVSKEISRGFACRDDRCTRSSTVGDKPGQFNRPIHIATDPQGILYVADFGNQRVQRFGGDGTFAGQAVSDGTGINTGEEPGFVLGNIGSPRSVAVNSDTLFVMQSEDRFDFFLHSFKTLPFHMIDATGNETDEDGDGYADNSVLLKYTPDYNFPGDSGRAVANDLFTYKVNDGLEDSLVSEGIVTVRRNYRAPDNLTVRCFQTDQLDPQVSCRLNEDTELVVELIAEDPDGVLGYDGLDMLSYAIEKEPGSGSLTLISEDAASALYRYKPDPDYNGRDNFRYSVTDNTTLRPNGNAVSETAKFELTILPVPDAPVLEVDATTMAGRGFPNTITARYSDVDRDPNEPDPVVSVAWGDGTVEQQGEIVELGEDDYTLTGPVLNSTSPGSGHIVSSHTFSGVGTPDVVVCIDSVDSPTPICETVSQDIEEATKLTSLLLVDNTSPAAGNVFTATLDITNQIPDGWSGLDAPDVRSIIDLPNGLTLVSADSRCNASGSPVQVACDAGGLVPGEIATFDFELRTRIDVLPTPKFLIHADVEHNGFDVAAEISSDLIVEVIWIDLDADNMPDAWELLHFGGLAADPAADADNDGLSNLEEYLAIANPNLVDTDSDGKTDQEEYERYFTNPSNADTDGDGLPDAWEIDGGVDPIWSDALEDGDNDGLTNAQEFELGTEPTVADTDEDENLDGVDNCPLTANRRQRDFDADTVGNACDPFSVVGLETIPDLVRSSDEFLALLRSTMTEGGQHESRIEIRDARSGQLIRQYRPLDNEQAVLALQPLPQSGGRLLALASERRSDEWPSITVLDTLTDAIHFRVNSLPVASRFMAMRALAKKPATAERLVALLTGNTSTGALEVHVTDVTSGALRRLIEVLPTADPGWSRSGLEVMTSDGAEAVAVFVAGDAEQGVVGQIQIVRVSDGVVIAQLQPEMAGFAAVDIHQVPDIVGDATDDIAVRLRNFNDGQEIIQVFDLPSGNLLSTVPALDAWAAEGDSVFGFSVIDTYRQTAIALFSVTNDALTVSVRDILSGNEIYRVPYSGSPSTYRNFNSILRDFGGGETNELAVVLENTSTGQHAIEVRDIQTGEVFVAKVSQPATRNGGGVVAYWMLLMLAFFVVAAVRRVKN
jgi:hypothetical protein